MAKFDPNAPGIKPRWEDPMYQPNKRKLFKDDLHAWEQQQAQLRAFRRKPVTEGARV